MITTTTHTVKRSLAPAGNGLAAARSSRVGRVRMTLLQLVLAGLLTAVVSVGATAPASAHYGSSGDQPIATWFTQEYHYEFYGYVWCHGWHYHPSSGWDQDWYLAQTVYGEYVCNWWLGHPYMVVAGVVSWL